MSGPRPAGFENVADQAAQQAKGWTEANPCRDGYIYTSPVGSFQTNGLGLYDMLGNARELVGDCVNKTYVGAPTDGSAWTSGDCSLRVMRGGTWATGNGLWYRSALRLFTPYDFRDDQRGFRVALSLP